jgi:hypothetical protein
MDVHMIAAKNWLQPCPCELQPPADVTFLLLLCHHLCPSEIPESLPASNTLLYTLTLILQGPMLAIPLSLLCLAWLRPALAATAEQWRGRSIYQYVPFIALQLSTLTATAGSSPIVSPFLPKQTLMLVTRENKHGAEEHGIRA